MLFLCIPTPSYAHIVGLPEGYTGDTERLESRLEEISKDGTLGEMYCFGVVDTAENHSRYETCPACGRRITTTFGLDEYRIIAISCPAFSGGGGDLDLLVEFRYYTKYSCSFCGFKKKLYENEAQSWRVACTNGPVVGDDPYTWYIIGSGTNIHCYVDPNNPHAPVHP